MSVVPLNTGLPLPVPQDTHGVRKTGTPVHSNKVKPERSTNPAAFQRELDSRVKPQKLEFSRHAMKRLDMRGISFTPDGLARIEEAVNKAETKGSRDTLVLAGAMSLVVNVPSRTVVTVMSRESMNELVITNIDSAVFA